MFRNVRGLLLAVCVGMIFTITANATKPTMLISFRVDNEPIKCFYTNATNVREFLEEQEISLSKGDKLSHGELETIEDGTTIELLKGKLVHLVIDGETIPHYTATQNVAELVAEVSNNHEINYDYDNNLWNETITNQFVLALTSSVIEVEETLHEIPYKIIIEEDDTLSKGTTEVVQEGIAGTKVITTEIEYLSGKEINRKIIKEVVTLSPQEEIIKEGTAEVISESAPYQYTQKYTMNASAYTADYNSTGKNPGDPGFGITASGMKARVGVVAVDPKVIPLGTELYIEGYGKAIAGDTGGAIKGLKIDLFFDTNTECRQFGRRNIDVWVLK